MPTREDYLACGTVDKWVGASAAYENATRQIERDITVFANSVGISTRVTSRLRSCAEQHELYRTGRTTAVPGRSQHEFGFAFDIIPVTGYQRYGATLPEAMAWLGALATYFGAGHALNERTHIHVGYYRPDVWAAFLRARDVGASLPYPGRGRRS